MGEAAVEQCSPKANRLQKLPEFRFHIRRPADGRFVEVFFQLRSPHAFNIFWPFSQQGLHGCFSEWGAVLLAIGQMAKQKALMAGVLPDNLEPFLSCLIKRDLMLFWLFLSPVSIDKNKSVRVSVPPSLTVLHFPVRFLDHVA